MSWLTKLIPPVVRANNRNRRGVPEGVWRKCDGCGAVLYAGDLAKCHGVCPHCGHHHGLTGRQRLSWFFDDAHFAEIGTDVAPVDRLKFKDSKRYKDRLEAAHKQTKERDALLAGHGRLLGMPVVASAFEFSFIGGSMGAVVGERFVLAAEHALAEHCPYVCFTTSGGARMQEGLLSLMQMAKTSGVIAKLGEAKLPYVVVLTHPTMGGVSASLAMLGDVILAEPKALIGFAGPRVIQQTVNEILPDGFQRSEFLLEKGAIDQIVPRTEQRDYISRMLTKLMHYNAVNTAESAN